MHNIFVALFSYCLTWIFIVPPTVPFIVWTWILVFSFLAQALEYLKDHRLWQVLRFRRTRFHANPRGLVGQT